MTFQLHHSFTEANREISTQPFQVTENGWGEFTVGVKVSFTADAKASPAPAQFEPGTLISHVSFHIHEMNCSRASQLPDVDLFHPLKLYGDEKSAEQGLPVVSETYDELVLVDPTWEVWQRCSGVQPKPAPYADWMAHVLHHRRANGVGRCGMDGRDMRWGKCDRVWYAIGRAWALWMLDKRAPVPARSLGSSIAM